MVGVALIVGEISGWIDAGEGAEIVNEVGLVKIAGFEGNLGPGDRRATRDLTEGLLEALDAAEEFRRQADFVAEDVDEMARADADSIRDAGDFLCFGLRMEFVKCEGDRRMVTGVARRDGEKLAL